MKGEKYLFVVSGPSGTGKDTVVAKLLGSHPEIEKTVSATTRAMREGEVNGVNYHFLTKQQFETALAEGNIVEHTCYCENYYGTLRSEVERHMEQQIPVILVIEVEGAGNIKRMYPGSTTIFVMPPDMKELERRLRYRGTEAEEVIQKRLRRYPVPEEVWEQYHQDQEINDRGIAIDRQLVESAIQMDMRSRAELTEQMQRLTCLENPNSVQQMKKWLAEHDVLTESLGKKQVVALLKDCPEDLREVLILRQQLAKSSVKKYIAMRNAACADGRVRGAFQFYGANRSGRWAGRNVQLQNLPQNHMEELSEAREFVRRGDYEAVQQRYGSVPDVLSELIRTAFIPSTGKKFIVSDFSAVEARVIAWLAGEQWRMKVFERGGDIYCASASQMFGVPVEKHGVNGHLRQKGKIAELALGYGGSVGALKAMGALEMGLTEEELPTLVRQWRSANPHITQLWWDVDEAVMTAVRDKTSTYAHGIRFRVQSGMLFIHLPSGRDLCYAKPRIGENQFGSPSVTYMGVGATKKWERIESYGPKFVENIVQGISRDLLCYAMRTLRCCDIVAHVHDEIILEADPRVSLDAVCEQMGRTPPWAKGLVLRADGYECAFYKKD